MTFSYVIHMVWVNIGLGNCLLPDGSKPLREPMLASYESNFTDQATILYNGFKNYTLRFNATCPRDNELKKMATDMIDLILWYHRW